ncbi:hypothetical protein BC835DRAFT_1393489 [Cytidiella melzeri]|nr:hypothetical protein BC835DRAFT_1393489 [Cytidiella melzeri]
MCRWLIDLFLFLALWVFLASYLSLCCLPSTPTHVAPFTTRWCLSYGPCTAIVQNCTPHRASILIRLVVRVHFVYHADLTRFVSQCRQSM